MDAKKMRSGTRYAATSLWLCHVHRTRPIIGGIPTADIIQKYGINNCRPAMSSTMSCRPPMSVTCRHPCQSPHVPTLSADNFGGQNNVKMTYGRYCGDMQWCGGATGLREVAHCRCLAVCTPSLPVSSADGVDAAECALNSYNRLVSSRIDFQCLTRLGFAFISLWMTRMVISRCWSVSMGER